MGIFETIKKLLGRNARIILLVALTSASLYGGFLYISSNSIKSKAADVCVPEKSCATDQECGGENNGTCTQFKCVCSEPEVPSSNAIGPFVDGPISGTFLMIDIATTKENLQIMIEEMYNTGIHTVILLASGSISNQNGVLTETVYFDDPSNLTLDAIEIAHQFGMEIYLGLASVALKDIDYTTGTPEDLTSPMGKMISFNQRLAESAKRAVESRGIPWNAIKGFYLGEMSPHSLAPVSPKQGPMVYLEADSKNLKSIEPDKKLIISPYVLDIVGYEELLGYYKNVYETTAIDIIAPQDSMGSLKISTPKKSAELFKALRDATALFPGKEAWGNVETQYQKSITDGNYDPSTIYHISSQIEAAKPYTSKLITWIYQHTMLSVPAFKTASSWTGQYTPEHAALRKSLRNDYIASYISEDAVYKSFPDVSPKTQYIFDIGEIVKRGVMSGFPDGTFRPNEEVSREQIAVVLVNAFALPLVQPQVATYVDVSPENWAFSHIETLTAVGATSGCSSTPRQYCPVSTVTKAQAALLALKSLASQDLSYKQAYPSTATYSDVPSSHWAHPYVEGLAEHGIYIYCNVATRTFCPDILISRASLAHMVNMMSKK